MASDSLPDLSHLTSPGQTAHGQQDAAMRVWTGQGQFWFDG